MSVQKKVGVVLW